MHITGQTRVFVIVGNPVGQVRAPDIFNALFREHGIDAVLVPAEVPPARLSRFVDGVFGASNIAGLWIAIPHKGPAVRLVSVLDPMATAAQAVNAIRRLPSGGLEGALFDGIGFVKALASWHVAVADKRALVVGTGGGGVAIAAALGERAAREVVLVDTEAGRAREASVRLNAAFETTFTQADSNHAAGFDIVVNATPLGMDSADPLPIPPASIDASATVVDIVMKGQPTPLVEACRSRSIAAYPGFEMLVQQTPEYLRFFGFDALADTVEQDLSTVRGLITPAGF